MYQANKANPDIREIIAVKGCPPKPEKVYEALQKAGISFSDNTVVFDVSGINRDLVTPRFSDNERVVNSAA